MIQSLSLLRRQIRAFLKASALLDHRLEEVLSPGVDEDLSSQPDGAKAELDSPRNQAKSSKDSRCLPCKELRGHEIRQSVPDRPLAYKRIDPDLPFAPPLVVRSHGDDVSIWLDLHHGKLEPGRGPEASVKIDVLEEASDSLCVVL